MSGTITVSKNGKFNVAKSGKFDLMPKDSSKGTCCCCKPYTLATHTTDGGTWNLSQYHDDGVAKPNRYWRLINNYTSYVPIQRGCVDENGKLVGLPGSTSTTTYKYTWTFRIEIGCKDGNVIRFPTGTENSSLYNC